MASNATTANSSPIHGILKRARVADDEMSRLVHFELIEDSCRAVFEVGGVRFWTFFSTLRRGVQFEPGSYFDCLVISNPSLLVTPSPAHVFGATNHQSPGYVEFLIDRSPIPFPYILDYLRYGPELTLPEDASILKAIIRETQFYRMSNLQKLACQRLSTRHIFEGPWAVTGQAALASEESAMGDNDGPCNYESRAALLGEDGLGDGQLGASKDVIGAFLSSKKSLKMDINF